MIAILALIGFGAIGVLTVLICVLRTVVVNRRRKDQDCRERILKICEHIRLRDVFDLVPRSRDHGRRLPP